MTLPARACCVCKVVKAAADFGPHKKSLDGLQYECRACVCSKVRAYMAAGGEEYKARKREYDKARTARLREELADQARIRYEMTRAEKMIAVKAWQSANPERVQATKQNYKHRRRAQEASGVKSGELLRWKRAQEKRCHWCRSECPVGYVVDHVEPLAKGGLHELSNLVIACRPCNARKSNKAPEIFAALIAATYHEEHGEVGRVSVTPEMAA